MQSAVRAASEAGLLTAVRCGGHSLAGFSTCDGGMVIDLSRMRQVLSVLKRERRAICRRLPAGIDRYGNAESRTGLPFRSGFAYRRVRTGSGRRNWMAHTPIWIVLR